jgi:glycosyltransferase involved in cell wall biosynthesis
VEGSLIQERAVVTGADNKNSERILYVDAGRNPSLLLSFVEPLKAIPTIDSHHLLESDFDVTGTNKTAWPNDPVAIKELEHRLRELAPTLIVFCRYAGPYARVIVEWARSANVPTIYHIDDNLLNVPPEIGAAKAKSHGAPRRVSTVRYLLDEATVAYCSNEPLRRELFGERPSPRVVAGEVYCASEIMGSPTTDEPPVIGYMGFGSHDHDFTFAVPALVRILEARPDVTFELFGNLAFPEALERFGARIRTIEPVREYAEFRQKLASLRWTIGICPLADTSFNKVKSNTKWVEYTASGFAVVASSNSIYEVCCADGCGMLVSNDDEWYSALDALLADKALHRAQVERAQRRVRENYSPDRLRRQILSVFTRARELVAELRMEKRESASDVSALRSPPPAPPPTTPPAAQSGETRLALDRLKGSRIQGWAYLPGEMAEGAAKSPVELWCGDLLVGRLTRHLSRPDVDAHLGTDAWPKGFLLPAASVNALGLLLGGEKGGLPPTVRFGGASKSTLSGGRYLSDLGDHPTLRSAQATHGWKIEDIWWANSHLLKVRSKNLPLEANQSAAKSVRVFQPCLLANGRTGLAEVDEFSIDERAGVYPFGVRNPLMPILLIGYDATGEISFSDLVPFPSLLRGGLHEAEVAACGEQGGSLSDLRRLSDAYLTEAIGAENDAVSLALAEIFVDLRLATGAEPIFDSVVREWLACVFSVAVKGQNKEARDLSDLGDTSFSQHIDKLLSASGPLAPRRGRLRLSLPACAIPTVGVLASHRFSSNFSGAPSPYILVDEANPQHRRLAVSFPGGAATNILKAFNCDSSDFPSLHSMGQELGAETAETEFSQPTAILIRDFSPPAREVLLFPVPKDEERVGRPPEGPPPAKICVFIRLFKPNLDIRLLLGSLATQVSTSAVEIVLVTANCDANEHASYQTQLADICPKDARIIRAASSLNAADAMNKAVESSSGDVFVFLDHECVLHDQRTLETITRIASTEGVGTVGCLHLRSRTASDSTPVFASAGYFPGRVDFMVAPHVALTEIDCSIALPNAVYAVAANSASLIALSADAWRRVKGFDAHFASGSFEVDLAARLADAGFVNLCTNLVSIFVDRTTSLPVGVPDTSHLGVWRLFGALKTSTILRSF